jgi:hypothetical protein
MKMLLQIKIVYYFLTFKRNVVSEWPLVLWSDERDVCGKDYFKVWGDA